MRPENHPSVARATESDRSARATAAHRRPRVDEPSDDQSPGDVAGGFSRLLATLPLSLGLTVATTLTLSVVAAAVAYRSADPSALLTPLAWGTLGLSSVVGGILAARRNLARPVLAGLLGGVALALLLWVLSWLTGGEGDPTAPLADWLVRLGVVVIHTAAAYLSRPRPRAPEHAAHAVHAAGKHHTHR